MHTQGTAARDSVNARLARPRVPPTPPLLDFIEFATMDEYPDDRPAIHGIATSTARAYFAAVRQIGREVCGDELVYFNGPPDWETILRWRDEARHGGKARLESHRKALLWLAAWWGQGGANVPRFIAHRWNTTKNIATAIAAGTFRRRERFLQLPDDISVLLSATPNVERVRSTRNWAHPRHRHCPRYLDATWRAMVYLAFYTGCRPSELATLRLRNYQPERGGILGWAQPKDRGKPRDVVIPETFVWRSAVDPSLDHYIRYIRPRVATEASPDSLFLTTRGKKWIENRVTSFMGACMRAALGNRSTGGHGLWRACATYRYRCGWSLSDIAELFDDSERVISESYIDWAWIRSLPRGTIPHGEERPRLPAHPIKRSLRPREEARDPLPYSTHIGSIARRHTPRASTAQVFMRARNSATRPRKRPRRLNNGMAKR